MGPKEDPADRAARLRERRISELERMRAAQENAAGMGAEMRSIYGMKGVTGPLDATGAKSARYK